jgi:hypothetical protein
VTQFGAAPSSSMTAFVTSVHVKRRPSQAQVAGAPKPPHGYRNEHVSDALPQLAVNAASRLAGQVTSTGAVAGGAWLEGLQAIIAAAEKPTATKLARIEANRIRYF